MNESTVMDSARDAAAASDAVISPSLWATLREPSPGWLYPIKLNLALAKCSRVFLPRASKPSDEMEELLVQASQLLEGLEPGCDKPPGCHD